MLTQGRLQQLIARFRMARIAVVGDFFLDKYLEIDPALAETSVETGKVAHQVMSVRCSPGAAGTVVNNLASLQAGRVEAFGATGDDGDGYALRKELTARGCDIEQLFASPDLMTPTYLKPVDRNVPGLEGEHSRYDTKNRRPTPKEIGERIVAAVRERLPELDAVIVADQVEAENEGIVTEAVRESLSGLAERAPRVVFWADSRRRIRRFRNMILKPNQFEAVGRDCPRPGEVIEWEVLISKVDSLRQETRRPLVVTRGAAGAVVIDHETTLTPTVRLEGSIDTTGAGDSVTAGAVLALAAGASLPEATLIGMLVASITSQQLGTTGVASPEQLPERLDLWHKQNSAEHPRRP